MNIEIPAKYAAHLSKLAEARNENINDTASFLLKKNITSNNSWIDSDPRYDSCQSLSEQVIDVDKNYWYGREKLMKAIQALPPNIRPKTDGVADVNVEFFVEDGVQGISFNGTKFLDTSKPGSRDVVMHDLINDKFNAPMSVAEYRIYNFCNSQYYRLTKEPLLFTMPVRNQVACDAGAFNGYKAIAMAELVGPDGHVLAYEIDLQNFSMLKRNIELNGLEDRITPVLGALSNKVEKITLYTQEHGTMAHSLTMYESTGNPTAPSIKNPTVREVNTFLLGQDLKERGYDRVDCLHVSVNGHEAEVVAGLGSMADKIGVYRVVCVFKKDGVSVEDKIKQYFSNNQILFSGRSGGSLLGGPLSPYYHVNGYQYEWLLN